MGAHGAKPDEPVNELPDNWWHKVYFAVVVTTIIVITVLFVFTQLFSS